VLKRAENVQVLIEPDAVALLTGKWRISLQVGKSKTYSKRRLARQEWKEMKLESDTTPVFYMKIRDRNYWRYDGKWFTDIDDLQADEVKALVTSYGLGLKKKVSEAKTRASAQRVPDGSLREFIPESVRHRVWERDGGACRQCGATSDLQYDHLIPVSMGGTNTEDNLQILCATCNRQKGASVV
jgi:5-methylcytosine-specific restriction endonuclease McrA